MMLETMLDQQDFAYWNSRADMEFQMAQRAKSLDAARPHYRLAINYLERAENLKRLVRQKGR
ncbi:MAG TPA: hypothetical protein VNT25_02925 [Allosphingosinicella sp.]|nr:hypothetical protein [Allosphingosinicella sp.]